MEIQIENKIDITIYDICTRLNIIENRLNKLEVFKIQNEQSEFDIENEQSDNNDV